MLTERTAARIVPDMNPNRYRVFLGSTSRQLDANPGCKRDDAAWYFEPVDYDGDVLWSPAYATKAEAIAAAALTGENVEVQS